MNTNCYINRHLGPREEDLKEMLETIGVESLEKLIDETVPTSIRLNKLDIAQEGMSEQEFLNHIKNIALKNKIFRSYIGMGYYGTNLPSVIKRNVFENPGWYTSYTPYQAEISQGRLEALLNFQTVITELTGMALANCSLLDEATSAAEAMSMMFSTRSRSDVKAGKNKLFVDENIFPQTLDVIELRSEVVGIEVVKGDFNSFDFSDDLFFGAILQYPAANGIIPNYKTFTDKAHEKGMLVTAVVDIMAMVKLQKPAEWGADIVVGSTQRFGIPMGYGGPHAGFLATSDKYKRNMPGRIIGVSVDKHGKKALRMALQTREQHIKRERATSNICTAQALLATMAGFYAVYHGPKGLQFIANEIHAKAVTIENKLIALGYTLLNDNYFDTLRIKLPEGVSQKDIQKLALEKHINFNYFETDVVTVSMDETVNIKDINDIIAVFAKAINKPSIEVTALDSETKIPSELLRNDNFMQQKVFNSYHSETDMMRYINKLVRRDIALNHSMIPLGSCTMKLNPATTMLPLSWDEFGGLHPFVPTEQAQGYQEMIEDLKSDLAKITGFDNVSVQPNSGAAGEHTGLMVIRAYQKHKGEGHRNVCLIPASAHGTNPASAIMAGMKVIVTATDKHGNISVEDLKEKAEANKDNLAAVMITYPSTHGVFESKIREMVKIIHDNGGLVYMDGANMNAQLGLTNPGHIGADVCHLNLHKTFAIPHGGGGPGVGAIGVAKHLTPFLPGHSVVKIGGEQSIKAVAAAPYGSASVLPITYGYIKMSGFNGLKKSAEYAILNANYLAAKLKDWYSVLYTGETGRCAHEMILDLQHYQAEYHVSSADIARRLMDYGFHAPTLSFPVHETLMVEPTESESKAELDRFAETLIQIRKELDLIKEGKYTAEDNPLVNSPHTADECAGDEWNHVYSRETAAFPLAWIRENKFWPYVGKIDNGYGDRNLMCTCDPIESYE